MFAGQLESLEDGESESYERQLEEVDDLNVKEEEEEEEACPAGGKAKIFPQSGCFWVKPQLITPQVVFCLVSYLPAGG